MPIDFYVDKNNYTDMLQSHAQESSLLNIDKNFHSFLNRILNTDFTNLAFQATLNTLLKSLLNGHSSIVNIVVIQENTKYE